jgi:hypothetical protein
MHPDAFCCARKRAHRSHSDAQAEIGRMRRVGVREADRLRVYQCGYCQRFHIGKGPRQEPVRDERARGPPGCRTG